jgi:hypothetical protein
MAVTGNRTIKIIILYTLLVINMDNLKFIQANLNISDRQEFNLTIL